MSTDRRWKPGDLVPEVPWLAGIVWCLDPVTGTITEWCRYDNYSDADDAVLALRETYGPMKAFSVTKETLGKVRIVDGTLYYPRIGVDGKEHAYPYPPLAAGSPY